MSERLNAPLLSLAILGFAITGCGARETSSSEATQTSINNSKTGANEAGEANEASEAGEASEASEASAATTHGDPALRAQARFTADQAQAAALAVRPGSIVEWELERESGGSGLRYSYVIRQSGHDYEVGVDARDGRILENGTESANPD